MSRQWNTVHLERGMGKLSLHRDGKIPGNLLAGKRKKSPKAQNMGLEKWKTRVYICVYLDTRETGLTGRYFSVHSYTLFDFWTMLRILKNKTKPETLRKSHRTSGKRC